VLEEEVAEIATRFDGKLLIPIYQRKNDK
jgi:hypothetical protein